MPRDTAPRRRPAYSRMDALKGSRFPPLSRRLVLRLDDLESRLFDFLFVGAHLPLPQA
jgi:hypothetical protein